MTNRPNNVANPLKAFSEVRIRNLDSGRSRHSRNHSRDRNE